MALRSGYKGFKKLLPGLKILRPGTLGIDNDVLISELNEIFLPRSEQAVLGAKNRLPNNAVSQTLYDIVWTKNADDSLTANGTVDATNNSIITILGPVTGAYLKSLLGSNVTYKMSGCPSGGSSSTYYFRCYKVSPWTIIADNFGDAEATLNTSVFEDNAQYNFVCAVNRGIQADNLVFKPMLRLASDPDDTYVPYAMTNSELTDMLSLTEHTVTGTTDANGLLVVSNIPPHPIIYCFGAPSGGGNCYAEARPGGGGIAFYLHNAGTKIASTEVTVHYYDFVK